MQPPIPLAGVLPGQAQYQETDRTHGAGPARALGPGPGGHVGLRSAPGASAAPCPPHEQPQPPHLLAAEQALLAGLPEASRQEPTDLLRILLAPLDAD